MPLRDLRKLWSSSRQKAASENVDAEATASSLHENTDVVRSGKVVQQCSLPLLQVWPSQESPKTEDDSAPQQRFIFNCEDHSASQQNDSGIDSVQASPSPRPSQCFQQTGDELSPTPSMKSRRASSAFLHPNHARLIRPRSSSEQVAVTTALVSTSMEDDDNNSNSGGESSTNSSMNSIAGGAAAAATSSHGNLSSRHSDPWDSRRRSSAITARYSMLDALDLEYALIRAATRSSVGHSSFSHSLHKLTFTQTLAFPALARGLANRRRRSVHRRRVSSSTNESLDTGTNNLVKALAVIVLVFTSLLVFGIVFNYVTV